MAPLTQMPSMTPMAPKIYHLHQWIANVSNGAIDINDVIDAIGFHCRLWKTHRHMVIAICANGDGVYHWHIRSIAIGANGLPLAPFFVDIGANGEIPNCNVTFPFYPTGRRKM